MYLKSKGMANRARGQSPSSARPQLRRGGINSYLRGRGSRSERGPVCAGVRARASLALRLPIQCHRHISTEPPPPRPSPRHPRLAQPRAGPAPPPPGPPSLSRAPINQRAAPRARQPLPLPLQLPARARAPASRLSGSAPARWQRDILPRPRARERVHPPRGGAGGVAAPRRAAVLESPGRSYPRVSPTQRRQCSAYLCSPSSSSRRFPPGKPGTL